MPNPSLHSHRGLGYSRRSHRHLGVATICLWSGRRRPPCLQSMPGRLRSLLELDHRHSPACGQGEGDGIVGREVAFTRWPNARAH